MDSEGDGFLAEMAPESGPVSPPSDGCVFRLSRFQGDVPVTGVVCH